MVTVEVLTISVPTLTLATGVVGLSVTIVMALLYGRHRAATGYVALMRGLALHAFGLTVLGFEAAFPDGVGIAVANTAMAISPIFYIQAIGQLLERRLPLRALALLAAIVILGILFLIFVQPSTSLRLTVLGTYFLVTQAIEVGVLARGLRREPSAAYRTLFGLVVAITMTMLWRTLWFAANPDAAHTAGTPSVVLFMTNMVFFATTGLAWVGVLEDRYRRASLLANVELSRLTRTDDLTGLANRRHFDDVVATEVARSLRYGRPLTLVTLDLDHFKVVNDTLGHSAGDRVLRRVAQVLRSTSRASDLPARLGGEEFALLLPETGLGDGERLAERVRTRVRATGLPSGRDDAPLTISAGVAALAPSSDARAAAADDAPTRSEPNEIALALAEALVDGADRALYAAKRAGRDRTVVADEIVALDPDAERRATAALARG
jgi:diguanylate cyclase (GGDEF)-like protein